MLAKPDMMIAAPVSIFRHVPEDQRVRCGDCDQECAADANSLRFASQGVPIHCTSCAARQGLILNASIVNAGFASTSAYKHLVEECQRQGGLN